MAYCLIACFLCGKITYRFMVCIPTKMEKGWALLVAYTARIVSLEASRYRCEATTRCAQVLDRYAVYGDAVLGRFGTKPDGSRTPNVRAVVKPLLGLFHGEAGGRKWRQQLDVGLLKKPASVSEVIQVLHGSLVDTQMLSLILTCPYRGHHIRNLAGYMQILCQGCTGLWGQCQMVRHISRASIFE